MVFPSQQRKRICGKSLFVLVHLPALLSIVQQTRKSSLSPSERFMLVATLSSSANVYFAANLVGIEENTYIRVSVS
jgi:hypothetical protein